MEEHQGFWYLVGLVAVCFFFSSRRRHTRFDCDWSSDVCSSDLVGGSQHLGTVGGEDLGVQVLAGAQHRQAGDAEIGRASCRGRGEISVVAVSLKKKKKNDGVCTDKQQTSIMQMRIYKSDDHGGD